jgi:hypothetical protein
MHWLDTGKKKDVHALALILGEKGNNKGNEWDLACRG